MKHKTHLIKLTALFAISLTASSLACAKHYQKNYKDELPAAPLCTACANHWYVGANLGVSRTHDLPAVGSGDSVTQIGPGWSVDLGYQFARFYQVALAGELGFTQYHQSSENLPGVNIANTEHFSTYAAAVGTLPIFWNLSVLGKLGIAYSYAKKVFVGGGASGSANAYNLYYGGGLSYAFTPKVDMILQWARARGNGQTGSTDLTSLGLSYNFA